MNEESLKTSDVSRRDVLVGGAMALAATGLSSAATAAETGSSGAGGRHGSYVTVKDGTQIYFKDWGSGQPIVFSHGWPLSSDDWEGQMIFFAEKGYRCIAHDRRGHGRSSQPWSGNEMDTYSDDLATLTEALDLK